MEKQCLSCTGQSSVVLSAFKIACLAYAPTPLMYRQKVFTRHNLILLRGKMLNQCWQRVSKGLPWRALSQQDYAKKHFDDAILMEGPYALSEDDDGAYTDTGRTP